MSMLSQNHTNTTSLEIRYLWFTLDNARISRQQILQWTGYGGEG